MQKSLSVKNNVGIIVVVAVYLIAAWCAGARTSPLPITPSTVLGAQVVVAILGMIPLHLHMHALAPPTRRGQPNRYWCLSGPLGQWIFLTRQTISLQAVHLVASLVTPFCSARLAVGTYTLAVYIGGLATFVTIQFFALVTPNAQYQKDKEAWAAQGVYFGLINDILHTPGLFLTLADICVCKNRASLGNLTLPVQWMALLLLLYTLFYLGLISANNAITSHWPYEFLYDFKGAGPWVKFIVVQFSVLMALNFAVLTISMYVPAFWHG